MVVDSFSAFHGGDQTTPASMSFHASLSRDWRTWERRVIVVHHDGKAETAKDYRGSSDFKAAIDQGYHVANFGGDGHWTNWLCGRSNPASARAQRSAMNMPAAGSCGATRRAKQTVSDQLTVLLRLNPGITARRFDEVVKKRGIGRDRARAFLAMASYLVRFAAKPGAKTRGTIILRMTRAGLSVGSPLIGVCTPAQHLKRLTCGACGKHPAHSHTS